MKKERFCFLVFFVVILLSSLSAAYGQVGSPSGWEVEAEKDSSGGDRERARGLGELLGDFELTVEQIFHPAVEFLAPLPLRLGLGVKPHPEPIFKSDESEMEAGTWVSEPEGTSFFVRKLGKEVSVYSLSGDFSDLTKKKTANGTLSSNVTTAKNRGEVWGAKIARGEGEMSGWFKDSGVILALIGVVGIAVLVVIFLVVRRIW